MNKFNKKILVLLLAVSLCGSVYSAEKPLELSVEENAANMEMVVKDNYIKAKYSSAEKRFLQGNVKVSYDDFADLISKASHDDYVFMEYGIKMAEYGFFDLSEDLIRRLDNNLYTAGYVKDVRRYYYPSAMLEGRDIVYLADAYAGIVYNNLALETTSELLNTTRVGDSDYKNYLIALGSYKSNNLQMALKYIDNAIIENKENINYKVLKAKILADMDKSKQALAILKEIKKHPFNTIDFQTKVQAIEEYVSYKTSKDEALKDYHLAYYYHLQDRSLLAVKVLQSAILQAKQYAPDIFALLSKVYYDNDEPSSALEYAQRAYNEDCKNYMALMTLANINYDERRYEDALNYFKKAKKVAGKSIEPEIGLAKTYLALEDSKKSKKIYEKLLRKNKSNEDLIIGSLKVFPQRADEYLPKVIATDISNNEIWLGMAGLAIRDQNYSMAETCLNNAFYIDENHFKYYYYLGCIFKARGDIDKSNLLMIKSMQLSPGYDSTKKVGYSVYEK